MRSLFGNAKGHTTLAALLVTATLVGCGGGTQASGSSAADISDASTALSTAPAAGDTISSSETNTTATDTTAPAAAATATATSTVGKAPASKAPAIVSSTSDSDSGTTLSWLAPAENTDGTALTDLAGFNVYYGATATDLDHTVNVQGVGNLSYVIDNLGPGTWYFSVTAVNADGYESPASSPVKTTI